MQLKVCLYNLTTTTQVGGVETFVIELSRHLAYAGHLPVIVAGKGSYVPRLPGVKVICFPFIPRSIFRRIPPLRRAYSLTKLLERLSFAARAVPALSGHNLDVIHIQKPYDLAPGVLLKKRSGAALVFGSHGRDFFPGDRLLVHWVDGAMACSKYNAQETLIDRYHLDGTVVYNGVDVNRFRFVPDEALRRHLLRGQDHVVLSAGRLVPWKGMDTVLQAVALLRLRGLRVALAIAGEGPAKPALDNLARKLGIAEMVTFLGRVERERMPALISSCDVLAAGSFANETFGIVLAEAMACQRPVVATRFGGFPEVVEDKVTGLLVPPRDHESMAAALETLLIDPDKAEQFGRAGRERVMATFTWEAVTERVLHVYAQALSRRQQYS
jgi:D-inositol-3-phosphate glycosyltransferase